MSAGTLLDIYVARKVSLLTVEAKSCYASRDWWLSLDKSL